MGTVIRFTESLRCDVAVWFVVALLPAPVLTKSVL